MAPCKLSSIVWGREGDTTVGKTMGIHIFILCGLVEQVRFGIHMSPSLRVGGKEANEEIGHQIPPMMGREEGAPHHVNKI